MCTASATQSSKPSRAAVAASASRSTASIRPVPAAVRSRTALRRATTRAASSRERIPATVAAAISPWLCPTTTSGSTPAVRQAAARATETAHSTGWTMSTRPIQASPSRPVSTSVRDQSVCGASAAAHRSITAANAGSSAYSRAPIAAHCEPWPGKTKAVRPRSRARPATVPDEVASGSAA